ncbi:uncharacterized protein ARMOST_15448 [Armillaria ostoyae]|uniref:Metallo-beta-lactamase domain-containing protein n=1 Tax=Armillaria ostoyae TaxID=47428 RepID=A0A284RTB8_ARMOS|nr:uncharacterized protein ARMOST_15448 [Armillaria ostoyae]
MSTFKDLGIPSSQSTVIVKAIDVGVPSTRLPAAYFIEPVFPGYETFSGPIYAFIIEHALTGKRLMFDLGSTELVIGPGMDTRTFPSTPDSPLLESDFVNGIKPQLFRDYHRGLRGHGLLSDGSLYILNSPGHQKGHITALARVTPTSFVLLGGDSCHHPGQLRPTVNHHKHFACPGHILESLRDLSISSRTAPLLSVPPGRSAYADQETSLATISKLSRLDANPDVLVLIAHDSTAPGVIDEFPKSLNDWKAKGWKDKLMWAFLEKNSPAFRFG